MRDNPLFSRAEDAESSDPAIGGGRSITDEARYWLDYAANEVEEMVTNRPAFAVGAAVAAGVFLGWLIKRR